LLNSLKIRYNFAKRMVIYIQVFQKN